MAKKSGGKFYVVWQGHMPGIYTSWAKCQEQIKNYPNARYKSFPTHKEAEKALYVGYNGYYKQANAKKQNPIAHSSTKPIWHSLSVDAACSGNPGLLEYRGVHTKTKEQVFKVGPLADGTNNLGEFLAIIHGLAWLKQKNIECPIYTDSKTAMSWVQKKRVKTTLDRTAKNQELFKLIDRAEKWIKSNDPHVDILKWDTKSWGEIPADFGRK